MAVSGKPKPSTRRIRSRRSHFDTRLGSVEMTDLVELALVHRLFDGLERVGASDESFNSPSRGRPQESLRRP
jgi:hypothetical protein